jgi:hypothetical protein
MEKQVGDWIRIAWLRLLIVGRENGELQIVTAEGVPYRLTKDLTLTRSVPASKLFSSNGRFQENCFLS